MLPEKLKFLIISHSNPIPIILFHLKQSTAYSLLFCVIERACILTFKHDQTSYLLHACIIHFVHIKSGWSSHQQFHVRYYVPEPTTKTRLHNYIQYLHIFYVTNQIQSNTMKKSNI